MAVPGEFPDRTLAHPGAQPNGYGQAAATSAFGAQGVPVSNAFGVKDLAQHYGRRVCLESDFYREAADQLSARPKKELEYLGGFG
jgi:hypothetical protein